MVFYFFHNIETSIMVYNINKMKILLNIYKRFKYTIFCNLRIIGDKLYIELIYQTLLLLISHFLFYIIYKINNTSYLFKI